MKKIWNSFNPVCKVMLQNHVPSLQNYVQTNCSSVVPICSKVILWTRDIVCWRFSDLHLWMLHTYSHCIPVILPEPTQWGILYYFRRIYMICILEFLEIGVPPKTLCQPGYWSPLASHNPAIFSVPPGTEKLNKFSQTHQKSWYFVLHMFTIALILIPEQPTNMS